MAFSSYEGKQLINVKLGADHPNIYTGSFTQLDPQGVSLITKVLECDNLTCGPYIEATELSDQFNAKSQIDSTTFRQLIKHIKSTEKK
ncbi:unnamed protein product [Dovyalis caffra]|uniref:Uncharacterized protein n=1 Tax=Dovyalis caffra TaxID=77055 RepID=A0AAV1SJW4_9ROSI|nr:unnamed protein product [Dovyalis caffra]